MPKAAANPAPASWSPFINRELSWLEFNDRVLQEACNSSVPLLERVKFFAITHSNLDEFFEVRIASIKQQVESDVVERGPDGLTAPENLRAMTRRIRALTGSSDRCWRDQLVPELAKHGIHFLPFRQLGPADREWLDVYYREKVHPVLTPLAVDPSHPFPQVSNKSLNLITRVTIQRGGEVKKRLGIVQVPRVLPGIVRLPRADGRHDYVFLADVIGERLVQLFPGTELGPWSAFRVTRNSELYIDEEDSSNLLKAVEAELHNRRKGEAVRLEVSTECPADVREELLANLNLKPDDLYVVEGPLNPSRLMPVYDEVPLPELRDPATPVVLAPGFGDCPDLFAAIRERDHLLHHPYESFETVVRFLESAAADPSVLAIKQTLYRTGGDARIVGALMNAVRNGKQVTAVVELKARFDEANNIRWARALEEAGVHVVYGLVGYKIHCKVTLVVRNDEDGIRRYAHLGTGNYNPSTARLYTDLSLFTCRPEFGEDATNLFNLLTGICQFQGTRKLILAPFQIHARVLELIERETRFAREGLPATIVAKMNSLVDAEVIEALYRASRAGVKIDLIIRGICCLRPGVEGMSDHIRVRSVVDRFLEHGRIWHFSNSGRSEVYVASADWMPRNFFRRIEVAFPIEDGVLRERIIHEILERQLGDNTKARFLQPDGTYVIPPRRKGVPSHRCQTEFLELASGSLVSSHPNAQRRGSKIQMKLARRPG